MKEELSADDCDLELEPDTNEYALANNINNLFQCKPWEVPLTKLIYNEEKEPIAFVFFSRNSKARRIINELPTEFFNHQLLEYDYEDPTQLEKFMNKYGIFNFSPILHRDYKKFIRMLSELNPGNDREVSNFLKEFQGFNDPWFYNSLKSSESYRKDNIDIARQLLMIIEQLNISEENLPLLSRTRIVGFQNIKFAKESYKDWVYTAKRIKALLLYKNIEDLAEYTGDDPYAVIRACKGAVNIIQRELSGVSPMLDLFDITENQKLTHNDADFTSISQALALQLWNFTIEAKNSLYICKECGTPFVHKQTKSKTKQSRNTSLFCCDRCKNRNAQRAYRKTAGYRMKQNKTKGK